MLSKWGTRIALAIEPLEVEEWLTNLKKEEKFESPTLDRMRRVMSIVYRHGQRHGLIPRTQESNPMRFVRCKTTGDYETLIITPQQAYAIVHNLLEPERTLTLLAAGTGLHISECATPENAGSPSPVVVPADRCTPRSAMTASNTRVGAFNIITRIVDAAFN